VTTANGKTWRVTGLHHVAFAHDGQAALDQVTGTLGLDCASTEVAEGFVERMLPAGDGYLQLLEASGAGVIRRFLDRRGPALHHVAFTVTDIDAALSELRDKGTPLVDDHPRAGGSGTRIAFLHPSACAGLLVELVDAQRESTIASSPAVDRPTASASAALHELGRAAWTAATDHAMVREIGAGTLPHERFRWYFEQNVLYLEDYARAIGLIIGKAPDSAAIDVLARFLRQIVEAELPANRRFLERLGGDLASVGTGATMSRQADAYTGHLLRVAGQGTCAEGLTAVLPCQWSYGEIATHLAAHVPDDVVYADWIGMFANDEYDGLVAGTTGLLDRLVDAEDRVTMGALERIFNTSVRFEVQFWDMAYAGPGHQQQEQEGP
jgi:thiaminase II/methylmalonyl-CoA epimerase